MRWRKHHASRCTSPRQPMQACADAHGSHTVRRDLPGCQSVVDLDRIMLMALDKKNSLKREQTRRAFAELAEGPTIPATAGRRCAVIWKGAVVTVEKRTGVYDCVRYKGRPPAHYQRTCIYTRSVTTAPLSGPAQTGGLVLVLSRSRAPGSTWSRLPQATVRMRQTMSRGCHLDVPSSSMRTIGHETYRAANVSPMSHGCLIDVPSEFNANPILQKMSHQPQLTQRPEFSAKPTISP
ncbi:hypothetical protein DHODJN_25505 [Methylorubrum extorquens]